MLGENLNWIRLCPRKSDSLPEPRKIETNAVSAGACFRCHRTPRRHVSLARDVDQPLSDIGVSHASQDLRDASGTASNRQILAPCALEDSCNRLESSIAVVDVDPPPVGADLRQYEVIVYGCVVRRTTLSMFDQNPRRILGTEFIPYHLDRNPYLLISDLGRRIERNMLKANNGAIVFRYEPSNIIQRASKINSFADVVTCYDTN